MFERLFSYPAVLQRHRTGPLAVEREAYLEALDAKGMAQGTLLRVARYCRCLSEAIQSWPAGHCFDTSEVETLIDQWAVRQVGAGRASGTKWPVINARFTAMDFLRFLGLLPPQAPAPTSSGMYEDELADFIATKQQTHWLSQVTCLSARWQINRFLSYIEQHDIALKAVTPAVVDAYFELMGQRWTRWSVRTAARMLRPWFAHCEIRDWVQPGIAASIMIPRVYRQEGIPIGPPWDEVGRMLARTSGNNPPQLRDHAILLLLSVYGLRSGEVRRLLLDDIDWRGERIRVVRSKSGRVEWLPLEPSVGNALAHYLHEGRVLSGNRVVFLTLRAPHCSLSAGGLYHIVSRQFQDQPQPGKGCGPHGIRHACARHLIEAGMSFKETGDHLGHRSPESTRIYAKVDLASLRRVAFGSLGGLV